MLFYRKRSNLLNRRKRSNLLNNLFQGYLKLRDVSGSQGSTEIPVCSFFVYFL